MVTIQYRSYSIYVDQKVQFNIYFCGEVGGKSIGYRSYFYGKVKDGKVECSLYTVEAIFVEEWEVSV